MCLQLRLCKQRIDRCALVVSKKKKKDFIKKKEKKRKISDLARAQTTSYEKCNQTTDSERLSRWWWVVVGVCGVENYTLYFNGGPNKHKGS